MQTSIAREQCGDSFKNEIKLPYDPAVPMLGIHTEETRIERDTCTPMFITAPFIIARIWKQPIFPLEKSPQIGAQNSEVEGIWTRSNRHTNENYCYV